MAGEIAGETGGKQVRKAGSAKPPRLDYHRRHSAVSRAVAVTNGPCPFLKQRLSELSSALKVDFAMSADASSFCPAETTENSLPN